MAKVIVKCDVRYKDPKRTREVFGHDFILFGVWFYAFGVGLTFVDGLCIILLFGDLSGFV